MVSGVAPPTVRTACIFTTGVVRNYECGVELPVMSDMRNYKLILCGIILVFALTLKSGE